MPWLWGRDNKPETVSDKLKEIYKQKLLPLEELYKFHDFHFPSLHDSDFDAKPMVLFIGQYSTGKTTFIQHLLQASYPSMRIGPEPTTDSFIAVMHDETEKEIPGNALAADETRPFRSLTKFGNAFLTRFQCSTLKNDVLRNLTLIDTPGILSGEKQRIDRGYDFASVLEWFAERSDRIILLFDSDKLDISDEFRSGIEALKGYESKIRIVLNKADALDQQTLMRVHGALMWSLGKVLRTPEVPRVYIGSFSDNQLRNDYNRRLLEAEQSDLFEDLHGLPHNATLRKLNDLIKRARLAKVHACILAHLRSRMPWFLWKNAVKNQLIENLGHLFEQIQGENKDISLGDFPDVKQMQKALLRYDFSNFPRLRKDLVQRVDDMLKTDAGQIIKQIADDDAVRRNEASLLFMDALNELEEGEENPLDM